MRQNEYMYLWSKGLRNYLKHPVWLTSYFLEPRQCPILVVGIQYLTLDRDLPWAPGKANKLSTACVLTLSQTKILDSSKLEEFAVNNFKLDENGRKIIKRVEKNTGKRRNCSS